MSDEPVSLDLDFDDWREALGRWMGELEGGDPSWLSFAQWEVLYRSLAGEQRSPVDAGDSAFGRILRAHSRGWITSGELAAGVAGHPGLWNQVWSGAAVHRAGADWMGHLLAASLHGCPTMLRTSLPFYFLALRNESLLTERVWRHREGDVPSEFGDGASDRGEHAEERLLASGWDGVTGVETRREPMDPWTESFHWQLGWIGWLGNSITGDMVPDAAWQAAVRSASPLVARVQGYVDYFVLEPTLISGDEVATVDLLSGRPYTMKRSLESTSGWMLASSGWTSRN